LWIGWVALDKLEFIAVPSDKELGALFHHDSGLMQHADNAFDNGINIVKVMALFAAIKELDRLAR
jgi:hypothetical protein